MQQHVAEITDDSRLGHLEPVGARHGKRRADGALGQRARQT